MRKYMSKRQRPCDFCRSRKTACRINTEPPCRTCELHGNECTFVETSKPRKRSLLTLDRPAAQKTPVSGNASLFQEAAGQDGSQTIVTVPPTNAHQPDMHEPPPETSDMMTMEFLNDLDLDNPEYSFIFRTPQSPSLAAHHSQAHLTSPPSSSAQLPLDDPHLRPETLGFSGDMDPFLLRHYRTDDRGTFKFKQLSVHSVPGAPLPTCFLASHPSLFTRGRIGAAQESVPDEELRDSLEAVISGERGRRLISLYQRFIAPQYPIFVSQQLPDPASAPPSLLAAIYLIALPFSQYDDRLCLDLAYESPPSEALSRIINAVIASELHSPSLDLVQLLLLVTARPPAEPHVSDASYRWSILGMLVSASTNIGLHLDPSRWNLQPSEIAQRRRLAFTVYSLDKWLSASLGRPPHISDSNWLVTRLQQGDELESGLSDNEWNDLMEYSLLTSILSQTLSSLYTLQAINKHLNEPRDGLAESMAIYRSSAVEELRLKLQSPHPSAQSMMRVINCLGYHYTMLLVARASIHPFLNDGRSSVQLEPQLSEARLVLTEFCTYLASLKTDEVNGLWPPWCRAAFSSLCFSQLLMAVHAPTSEDAKLWVAMIQETRRQLRAKSPSLMVLRLGLLRIDSIFWRGVDQVLHLDSHVLDAFQEAQR